MFDAERVRTHHRGMLVVAAVSLFLLVGLVAVVLVNGSSPSPAASSAAGCVSPAGPTAKGYGETGAGVTPADPACEPAAGCDAAADGPTGRGYGESGAANVAACGPCPSDAAGATGRGYGESGVGVLADECGPEDDSSDEREEAVIAPAPGGGPTSPTPAPLMGGGGAHGGAVPGATGRSAPKSVEAADAASAVGQPLTVPLGAPNGSPDAEASRRNTAMVVGGLMLLLVAVAVALRRGRPGTAW